MSSWVSTIDPDCVGGRLNLRWLHHLLTWGKYHFCGCTSSVSVLDQWQRYHPCFVRQSALLFVRGKFCEAPYCGDVAVGDTNGTGNFSAEGESLTERGILGFEQLTGYNLQWWRVFGPGFSWFCIIKDLFEGIRW